MRTPVVLLRFFGKALLNAAGLGVVGDVADFITDVLPEVVKDVWDWWGPERSPALKQADLEALAHASPAAVHQAALQVVDEVAVGRPEPLRQALTTYLTQVPLAVRRSLKRQTRPGRPVTLRLREPSDLLPLLPARIARFRPGDRPVADWELVELLGVGGFGEVWKARHPDKPAAGCVALKFCLGKGAKELLRHEAAVLCQVMRFGRHPGIVSLLRTHLDADPPCLVYEYVEGGDLADLVRQWPDDKEDLWRESCRLMSKLADAVSFAHRLHPPVVHRDLKPANVLVQRASDNKLSLRVTDFGIGGIAARHSLGQGRKATGLSLVTALKGSHTPLYASPQQIRGEPPDPRDDVFALGIIWHQMLTGDLAAGRPGGTRWVRRLADQGLPADLVELLASCLEDRRSDRPADAGALARALHASAFDAPTILPMVRMPSELRVGGLRRFDAHSGTVERVVFSRDGRKVLSGGSDKTVRLWDVDSGQEVRRFDTGHAWVLDVAFSPDNRLAAAGCWDKTVRLWNLETGWQQPSLEGHRSRVLAVAFGTNGRQLLSACADKTVRLWDLESGVELKSFSGHDDLVWSVAVFSTDGRRLLSGSADRTVRLWDVESGEEIWCIEGHSKPVLSVALSRDGSRALSGGWDREVRLWNAETGREMRRLSGHTEWVWGTAFSPDGRRALSGGADGTVRLWDLDSGRELLRFEGHLKAVHGVAFSPDGRKALSAGVDGSVRMWGLPA